MDCQPAYHSNFIASYGCLEKTLQINDDKMQDWLYEEGEDETKSAYVAKLNELRQVGKPMTMILTCCRAHVLLHPSV